MNKVKALVPDHIFVYCENLENLVTDRLKYLQGLKFFYKDFVNNQKDIDKFIGECKKFEDEKGYLNENFFLKLKQDKGVFSSGPLANLFLQFKVKVKKILNCKLKIKL